MQEKKLFLNLHRNYKNGNDKPNPFIETRRLSKMLLALQKVFEYMALSRVG
jgi:hypothetical protein